MLHLPVAPSGVCMAFFLSYYNSGKIGRQQVDSGRAYGIFQLKNMEYCDDGCRTSLNLCRTDCMYFLDDDLRDDIKCVKKIIRTSRGLENWPVWKNHCKGRSLNTWTNCRSHGPWEVWG
ncbi:lysozyme C, milk isozyme-like isoform X2 [Sceloporus undulatus]|uniref:lysozyme C, milk isozyme-like isoform X2 n=1 Tax=Sceloporus undulatus TaxID=8520 RepID=UPI001C4B9EDC|nr:lysozyme C, milk isozyme-like isoform X2 [Sceloporus undulatus]